MITQDNYKVEVYASTTGTSAELGLLNGTYTWAVGGNILSDNGISNLRRSVDLRTGGGKAQESSASFTIVGGKYSQIMATAPILSKRVKVYRNNAEIYTGAITSVDVKGFESVVNINIESVVREVTLPYERSAIGDVEVDGTVKGQTEYIKTLGENCVLKCSATADNTTEYTITFGGGTATNKAEITRIIGEAEGKINTGANVYYVGEYGTYKLIEQTTPPAAGEYTYKVGEGANYAILKDEALSYGTILWSTEVFNSGIDGDLTVNGKVIDDVNTNLFTYGTGVVIDESEGILWRGLTNGVDYDIELETTAGNGAIGAEWQGFYFSNGVYYKSFQGGTGTASVTGDPSDLTNRTSTPIVTGSISYSPDSKSDISVAVGFKLTMNGYKFTADRLYCVFDYEGDYLQHDKFWIEVWVQSKESGTGIKTGKFGRHIDYQGANLGPAGTYSYKSTPLTYDNTTRKDFYEPSARGDNSAQYLVDITDFLYDAGGTGTDFYDGVELFIAPSISEEGANTVRQSMPLRIAQLNLVEGYIVGREGLKDTKIKVSNATTNGTIPLAYADVIKRQNLFGINSAAPSAGWGTAQVTQDGSGTALDSNYIMDNIPAGNLEGFLGEDVTTTQLKTEIARSVPAVTYYNEDGVESLLTVGTFENNTNYVRYNDVVGSVEVKSYSGRDVQPALSFEFGLGKNELKVTNVEQSIYSSSYVLDSVGLTPVQKLAMWTAGREIYKRHGLTTTQTVRRYPLVNDAAGAYRIAMALYSNMGYVNGTYYNRQTASFKTHKGVTLDIGEAVNIDMPQVKGVGVVTSVEIGVYGGTNAYVVDMIEAETITEIGDVFETGAQADNINETGTQTDNIVEDGA